MDMNQDNNQEELEQKISEAELDAQKQDEASSEAGESSFEVEPVESIEEAPPEKKTLSKARKIWRRILIWLVVIAIAFAGGFFLDTVMRYQPEVQRLNDLKSKLETASEEISSLEAEIERLNQFEDQNLALVEEIDQLETHLTLLSARAAVADASLAVEQDRKADARLALEKVGSSLVTLKSLLTADQAEVVDSMIQRHRLISIELESDSYSVQTDLELLTTKLITLENNLFTGP